MQQLATPDDAWRRLAPVLDEALDRLGETDRNAVVLRFLKDQGLKEVGMALGLSEEAAKKRVMRALEKLRAFFARRGFSVSIIVLSSAFVAHGAKAAPEALAAAIASGALAGGTAAVPALPTMVRETLSAWRWAKARLAGALCATAVVIALTVNWLIPSEVSASKDAQQIRVAAPQDNLASVARVASSAATAASAKVVARVDLAFRVVDAGTGAGIPAAQIALNYILDGRWIRGTDLATDAEGVCRIPIPSGDLNRLDAGALRDGYVQKFYTWRFDQGEPLPSVYILRLERGVPTGGWVRDESGQPVSGAEIAVQFPERGDSSSREPQAERLGFLHNLIAATTDAQGRWKCAIVPAGYDLFSLEVRHREFVTETVVTDTDDRNYINSVQRLAMKDLWANEAVIVLRRGFQVSGLVVDGAGQPVAEAKIGLFIDSDYERESVATGADGIFQLGGVAAGPARLGASAAGFAPASQPIDVRSNVSNLVLRLDRGTVISLRVVDEDANGITGAWVAAEGPQRHNANWFTTSDADGWVRFEGIPDDARNVLRFHGGAADFFTSRDVRLDLSAPEPRLQLRRALKVSGRVVDADSGQPIERFKAIPCYSDGSAGYDRSGLKHGADGNYTLTFTEIQSPFRVRIEADGYEPALSPPIPLEPREQWVELKVHRKDASRAIRGTVLLPDGQLAVGADVALLTFERGAGVAQAQFVRRGAESILTRTDANGQFQFEPDADAHTIAAAHSAGFGRIRIGQDGQAIVVHLSPAGRIEGQVRTRDRKWSGRDVTLTTPFSEAGLWVSFSAKSDAEGRFSLEWVPAGDYTLHLNPGVGKPFTDATPVEVRSGETTEAQIGGTGSIVTGRLAIATSGPVDWGAQIRLAALRPKANPPPVPRPSPVDARSSDPAERTKRLDLVESEAWRAWARTQRPSVTLKIAADGSFIAENMRAGEYELLVDLAATAAEPRSNPLTSLVRPTMASIRQLVTVTDTQEQTGETLDLGNLLLQPTGQRPQ